MINIYSAIQSHPNTEVRIDHTGDYIKRRGNRIFTDGGGIWVEGCIPVQSTRFSNVFFVTLQVICHWSWRCCFTHPKTFVSRAIPFHNHRLFLRYYIHSHDLFCRSVAFYSPELICWAFTLHCHGLFFYILRFVVISCFVALLDRWWSCRWG